MDQFEHRLGGSFQHERAIDYMIEFMKTEGLEVYTEPVVNVTQWQRLENPASFYTFVQNFVQLTQNALNEYSVLCPSAFLKIFCH